MILELNEILDEIMTSFVLGRIGEFLFSVEDRGVPACASDSSESFCVCCAILLVTLQNEL